MPERFHFVDRRASRWRWPRQGRGRGYLHPAARRQSRHRRRGHPGRVHAACRARDQPVSSKRCDRVHVSPSGMSSTISWWTAPRRSITRSLRWRVTGITGDEQNDVSPSARSIPPMTSPPRANATRLLHPVAQAAAAGREGAAERRAYLLSGIGALPVSGGPGAGALFAGARRSCRSPPPAPTAICRCCCQRGADIFYLPDGGPVARYHHAGQPDPPAPVDGAGRYRLAADQPPEPELPVDRRYRDMAAARRPCAS